MKRIKMQLFGHFSLTKEDGRFLKEEDLRSEKLVRLLCYLLMHRENTVTQQALAEVILPDTVKNPENTIRNLIYRLRNAMKTFGDEEFICSHIGAYQWNPEIEVESDYDRFGMLIRRLKENQNFAFANRDKGWSADQKKLCQEIIRIYNKNVTAKLADELWLLPQIVWFRTSYLETVKELCDILKQEEEWQEIELLCRRSLEADPYDEELHSWLIRSLYQLKRSDQAVEHYEETKQKFYKNFGIGRVEKLQQVYREMLGGREKEKLDIDTLMDSMQKEGKHGTGVLCDYQIFREFYQIEIKRIARLGIAEYMMMLTLRRINGLYDDCMKDPELLNLVDELELIVGGTLRTSDIATRYNAYQILVMLPGCSFEGAMSVVKRIESALNKQIGKRPIKLVYELREISGEGHR